MAVSNQGPSENEAEVVTPRRHRLVEPARCEMWIRERTSSRLATHYNFNNQRERFVSRDCIHNAVTAISGFTMRPAGRGWPRNKGEVTNKQRERRKKGEWKEKIKKNKWN
jgi:hypothetical protein